MYSRMAASQVHRGVLVSRVVVDHHVQLPTGVGAGDLTKNGRERLMTVPLMAGVGRVSGEHSMMRQAPRALNPTDLGGPSPPVAMRPPTGGPSPGAGPRQSR